MQQFTFRLVGRISSKKNSRITDRRTGRSFPSKKYTEWHKEATAQTLDIIPDVPLTGIKRVTLEFYHPDKRKYDLTNKVESIMDFMVDVGIIHDDNYVEVPELLLKSAGLDKKEPGCLVTIIYEEEKNK